MVWGGARAPVPHSWRRQWVDPSPTMCWQGSSRRRAARDGSGPGGVNQTACDLAFYGLTRSLATVVPLCAAIRRSTERAQGCHTATGTHMPRAITQCYLPPGRADIPDLTPAEAGTRLSDPGGMQG